MLFFPPSVHSWALRPTELSEWPDNLAIATNVVEAARRSGGGEAALGRLFRHLPAACAATRTNTTSASIASHAH